VTTTQDFVPPATQASGTLLIIGGRQIKLFGGLKTPTEAEEYWSYFRPTILEIDALSGQVLRQHDADEIDFDIVCRAYSHSYRGSQLSGDTLLTCTMSECVEFSLPRFEVVRRWSHPLFNDLHHAARFHGQTYVVSSGLDAVLRFTKGKEEPTIFPVVEGAAPDPTKDYRAISTKPHASHPNHVFSVGPDVWTTRFKQRDAICLTRENAGHFGISVERPHDGILRGGHLYFTSINGVVSMFDPASHELLAVYDLNEFYPDTQLGWCRGVEIVGSTLYVGFSSLRQTKILEHLAFLKRKSKYKLPSRIVEYDLSTQKPIGQIEFRPTDMSIIFNIIACTG
jgi:hypothetical protein